MLAKNKLREIGQWIHKNGRPLEAARFAYHFENASNEPVLECLSAYQNSDGGFGNGLESDCLNPDSSPIASSIALQLLFETGFRMRNEMIDRCLHYISHNHFDIETGKWATLLPTNNDYPHAPWWAWEEKGRNTWDFNPAIELAGLLLYYADTGSIENKRANECFTKATQYLHSPNEMAEHFHEVFCFINGLSAAKLEKERAAVDLDAMERTVKAAIEQVMCKKQEKWPVEYVAQPLDFMNKLNLDDAPLLDDFKQDIIANANVLIDTLPQNGVWDITWTWGENYADVFKSVRPHWQAVIAIDRLVKIKRLGLIEIE